MGRFETLNADTQDLVLCLLPGLQSAFNVQDVLDIIPEDIRMRAWDCDRRDHIKDQTENDARNWGVQFLKDLMAIARLKGGDLETFQRDLRAKVALHETSHPWARLSDIREIRDEYEHPDRVPPVAEESSGTSSTDSYLEELHEPDLPKHLKGKRRHHEMYEARVQESHKRRKYGRLRRSSDGGFHRKEKVKNKNRSSVDRGTTTSSHQSAQRQVRGPFDDGGNSPEQFIAGPAYPYNSATPVAYSMSPGAVRLPSAVAEAVDSCTDSLYEQRVKAELEVAEAELRVARLKHLYIQIKEAKERAEKEARGEKVSGDGEDAAEGVVQYEGEEGGEGEVEYEGCD